MKKFLIISLLIASSISYGRVVARPRISSRPHVNRSISKPSVVRVKPVSKPITHKASIRPKSSSFTSKTTVKSKPIVLNKPTTSSINNSVSLPKNNFNSSHNNSSNFSGYRDNYATNNSGFGITDVLLLNAILGQSNNSKVTVIDEDGNKIDEEELIKILEKEIKEEKNKFEPDKEKIKQYEELIKKLKE